MPRIRFRLPRPLLLAAVLAAVLAVLVPSGARADDGDWQALERSRRPSDEHVLRVWVQAFPTNGRRGAYGFVALRFHNPYPKPKQVHARIVESQGDLRQSYGRSLTLEPESVTRIHVPLPGTGGWAQLKLDGPGWRGGSRTVRTGSGTGSFAVLGVFSESRTPRNVRWQEKMDAAVHQLGGPRGGGGAKAKVQWCDVPSLPADWRLLSGFDVVIVNADPADLEAAQRDALARYVAAGGHLVLTGIAGTPEGPLGRMLESLHVPVPAARELHGRHGFGRWLALRDENPTRAKIDVEDWLHSWPFHGEGPALPPYASGIPTAFRARLEIPGLGEIPVQLFFFLILLFAILVGPVSYVWLRRRRRLPWLVLTIPLAGFLASSVILLYGFFSEGFGIRGSVRSFTLLDQRTHEAATAAGRTLYAGLSPSALVPGAGTLVAPPDAHTEESPITWDVDLGAGGRLDGAALPSRTPTPFATLTVGRARERLRFRRRDDGTIEVLHGPEFAPIVGEGAVLLRTPDGEWYLSDASGRLQPQGGLRRALRSGALQKVVRPMAFLPLGDDQVERSAGLRRSWYGHHGPQITNAGVHGFPTYFQEAWGGSLPPGSYLARVVSLPSFDSLGLDVDYEVREHVVLGFLADEDFVE